jgi:hypothetical protein
MHPLNAYLAQEIIRNDSRVRAAEQATAGARPKKQRAPHRGSRQRVVTRPLRIAVAVLRRTYS